MVRVDTCGIADYLHTVLLGSCFPSQHSTAIYISALIESYRDSSWLLKLRRCGSHNLFHSIINLRWCCTVVMIVMVTRYSSTENFRARECLKLSRKKIVGTFAFALTSWDSDKFSWWLRRSENESDNHRINPAEWQVSIPAPKQVSKRTCYLFASSTSSMHIPSAASAALLWKHAVKCSGNRQHFSECGQLR